MVNWSLFIGQCFCLLAFTFFFGRAYFSNGIFSYSLLKQIALLMVHFLQKINIRFAGELFSNCMKFFMKLYFPLKRNTQICNFYITLHFFSRFRVGTTSCALLSLNGVVEIIFRRPEKRKRTIRIKSNFQKRQQDMHQI